MKTNILQLGLLEKKKPKILKRVHILVTKKIVMYLPSTTDD